MTQGVPRNNLNFGQRLAILRALEAVCRREGEFAAFDAGHNDRTVAAGMDFPCTNHNVAGLRIAEIGQLRTTRTPTAPAPDEATEARIASLEAAVARLFKELGVEPAAETLF